jgi:hypothetical protein
LTIDLSSGANVGNGGSQVVEPVEGVDPLTRLARACPDVARIEVQHGNAGGDKPLRAAVVLRQPSGAEAVRQHHRGHRLVGVIGPIEDAAADAVGRRK